MRKEEGTPKAKKKLKVWQIILIVIVAFAIIGAIAGGGDDEPKKVGEAGSNTDVKKTESKETESTQTIFSVGDTVEQKGIQVTLVSTTESNGGQFLAPDTGKVYLILEFEIVNNSSSDIAVSSLANFEAYCDDYALNQDLGGLQAPEVSGKTQLDGSVATGKKMNGIIAYQVPTEWKEFEISVSPDFWSSKDIKFVINK